MFEDLINLAVSVLRKPLILENGLANCSVTVLYFLQASGQQIRSLLRTNLNWNILLLLILLEK